MLALYVLLALLGSVVAQVRLLTSPPIPDNNGEEPVLFRHRVDGNFRGLTEAVPLSPLCQGC